VVNARKGRRLAAEIAQERPRLRNFIRKRIANEADAEDILQDVFSELIEAYRLMQPVEHVSAWLFQVARNRIVDFFRRRETESIVKRYEGLGNEDDMLCIDELLPSPDAGPEAAYLYNVLIEEFDAALDDLPAEQQYVFMAHELEGRSFKQLAAETGLSVNTLLSRKHYAVRHLRERLQVIYAEFGET
jgi:RNA polymerase sigma factor (sigma-70 family)